MNKIVLTEQQKKELGAPLYTQRITCKMRQKSTIVFNSLVVAPEVNSCIIRRMTCYTEVHCPKCDSKEIKKAGFNTCGVQRYFCQNVSCDVNTLMLSYRYKAYNDGVVS